MIQELRNQSQSLLFKIVLVFIAVTFVISFAYTLGDRKEVLARINSKELLAQEYQQVYDRQLDNLRQTFGENTEQFVQQMDLRQRVFDQLFNRSLILDAADRRGVYVTDEELSDHIQQMEYFQKDGRFDPETYRAVLAQIHRPADLFEEELRSDLLFQKYQDQLLVGLSVSDAEVEQLYEYENAVVELDYLTFDPENFLDQTTYTDEELQQHYAANSKNFQSTKQYKVEYFTLGLEAFEESAEIRDRAIERYYEKNIEDYLTPAEVKARHILVKASADMSEDERDAKRKQLEGILKLLNEGSDFEEVAKQHSEDLSKTKGGDLGWFKPGEMVPAFEAAAFALQPGQISEIVESPFGFHIIRVDEKKEESQQAIEEVREGIVATLKEARAEKMLEVEYDRMEDAMKEKGLVELAKTYQTEVKTTDWFDESGVIDGLGSVRPLVSKLDLEEAGNFGRWRRNPVQGHVFYKLSEIQEPSTKPFEEVQEDVIRAVRLAKAQELVVQTAQGETDAMLAGETLAAIAERNNLEVDTTSLTSQTEMIPGVGRSADFKKNALELNETTRLNASQYEGKIYLMVFKSRSLPEDETGSEHAAIRDRLFQSLRQAFFEKEVKRLKDDADYKILNPYFDREASQS